MTVDIEVFLVLLTFLLMIAVIVCSMLAYHIGEEHGRRDALQRKELDDAARHGGGDAGDSGRPGPDA